MITKQNFVDFLKDMSCLEEYKENIANTHNYTIDEIWDKIFSGEYKTKNLIDAFFTWKHTPQGSTFWELVDDCWKSSVEKDEKESEKIPVYDVTYSSKKVAKVYCPKTTRYQSKLVEDLLREKYPSVTIYRSGDYLIAEEKIPSGLVVRK